MNNIISERDAEQQEVELASSNPKETIIDTTKEALLAELKEAHSIDKKVATFAKVMDSYGLDPILGFFT